jgi:peptide deformylase
MELIDNNNELLQRPSKKVDESLFDNNGHGLKPIASLLMQKINEYNAAGISACQIGIDLAIFAIFTDSQPRICVNPEIVAAAGDMKKDFEGCLSFPGLLLKVNRPDAIIVRYKNIEGVEVTEQLEGFTARAWLHEFDHTNGICFTSRVSKLTLDMAKKKLIKQSRRIKK